MRLFSNLDDMIIVFYVASSPIIGIFTIQVFETRDFIMGFL